MPNARTVALLMSLVCLAAPPLFAEITLIGAASMPGTSHDMSALTGNVPAADGTPTAFAKDQFGSAGSAIAYTGRGDEYLQVNDRGPLDGAVRYDCRAHLVKIEVKPGAATPVTVSLLKTTLLKNEQNESFVGAANAFSANPAKNLRLDPEGARLCPNGADFWIADEYGPSIWKFSSAGKRLAALTVPEKFLIQRRSDNATQETSLNASGRQTNRGMEGLAISPDGKKLFALMQGPLIQDAALDDAGKRIGANCRLLEIDIATNSAREFLYRLEEPTLGTNEILTISANEFLVIERDGKAGGKAACKKIFRINLAAATDISKIEKLPATGIPAGVKPVAKSLFLDLLDPKFKLAGPSFPEKIEGLAFGPTIAGNHTLIITNDNDLIPETPNTYYVFSIPPSDLPNYQPQKFDSPSLPK